MAIIVNPKAPEPVATEPLSASVSVSLTATDKARLSAAATAKGMSMSAWARTALLNQLNH